jgi:hypothetical protein
VRQIHHPVVRVTVHLLDPGQGAGGEELQQRRHVQGCPVRQPQADRAGTARRGLLLPERTRRLREHLEQRVVELPHAAEPGGERDLREAQVGGLDQDPGGLRPLGPGQRQRSGAEFGGEHPVQVPLGVAEPARQPRHALAVDHAVTDQPHRTAHHVGADVPLRRAGSGVRAAAAAGPEAGPLRRGGARVEGDVLRLGCGGRAGRPAVDAGGSDGRVEPAVEPLVAAVHRPVAALEIQFHAVESAPAASRWLAGFGHGRSPASGRTDP